MAVLYRKYRPTKLQDVVGQEQVTTPLIQALAQGKLSHAYLFIGPRGTGKTSVARILAHAVNNFDYQVEDNYLDIIEIDAASNTGVDNIRELREKAVIAPTKGKYKVYIIDEVHMLTKSASNALLKTLEEPPEHVIFIMATTDAHKVPITISSRTQVHTFKLAQPEIMQQHLHQIANQEGINITDDALTIVVRRGGGSFRDSLSILDQITSLANSKNEAITAEQLSHALGLPQTQTITELLQNYQAQDQAKIHTLLQDLLNTGIRPEIIASELIDQIIAHPSATLLPLLADLPKVQPPFPEAKLLLALLNSSQNSTPNQPKTVSNPPITTSKSPQSPSSSPETHSSPAAPSDPSISQSPANSTSTNAKNNSSDNSATAETTTSKPSDKLREKIAKRRQRAAVAPETRSIPTTPSDPTINQRALKPPLKPKTPDTPFDWADFLERVAEDSQSLGGQLKRVSYEYKEEILHIYPEQKLVKDMLERPKNHDLLAEILDEVPFIVHDITEKTRPQDDTLSQISAIMGNVKEVNTDLPF